MDGLKKSVNIVETEIAMVRKGQLENEAMIKDLRNNFDKDIGDQFDKLQEQIKKVGTHIDTKLTTQDESIENLKSDLQGFTFKHKQAV